MLAKINTISTKIKIIVFTLGIIIAGIITLTILLSESSKKDALVINIAGKQRMLSQKMTKEVFYLKSHECYKTVVLQESINEFDMALKKLLRGDEMENISAAPTPQIEQKLLEVNKLWQPFKTQLLAIEKDARQIQKYKNSILPRVEKLLELSDDVVKAMVEAKLDGKYIDDSGRQRMLSQRMTMLLLEYFKTNSEPSFVKYKEAKKLYDETLMRFKNSPHVKSFPHVKEAVETNFVYWREYLDFMKDFQKIEDSFNLRVEFVFKNNTQLLNTMDQAVHLFTIYQESKNERLRVIQYSVAFIALLVLFYIRSVISHMESNITSFVKKTKKLGDLDIISQTSVRQSNMIENLESELQEASEHLGDYLQKIQNVVLLSQEAISKIELAINTLESIADEDFTQNNKEDERLSESEDIIFEASEHLMHVSTLLKKLQHNLQLIHSETFED